MFESALARFESGPQGKNSLHNKRRSGLKKVDDEHLLRLKTREVNEAKDREALVKRKQRSNYIVDAFKRLTDDGRVNKEEMKEELDKARERQIIKQKAKSKIKNMFACNSSTSNNDLSRGNSSILDASLISNNTSINSRYGSRSPQR